MTSEFVNKAAEKAISIFTATEESLTQDWNQKENLQFPTLLTSVISRLKLVDAKAIAEVDPYVRSFVRSHPLYQVQRGAKGGIMLASVFEAKLAKKNEVASAKKVIKAQIDAKVSGASPASAFGAVATTAVVDSEESEVDEDGDL